MGRQLQDGVLGRYHLTLLKCAKYTDFNAEILTGKKQKTDETEESK